jgi:hypothetical protein
LFDLSHIFSPPFLFFVLPPQKSGQQDEFISIYSDFYFKILKKFLRTFFVFDVFIRYFASSFFLSICFVGSFWGVWGREGLIPDPFINPHKLYL